MNYCTIQLFLIILFVFFFTLSKTILLIYVECENDDMCYGEQSTCINNVCDCVPKYYQKPYRCDPTYESSNFELTQIIYVVISIIFFCTVAMDGHYNQ